MVALVLGEDQDVIEVSKYKSVDHVSEGIIDNFLTGGELESPKGMTKYLKCPVGV